jgi:hypothetical protein
MLPIRFIQEEIDVIFDERPALSKKQGCPDQFRWQNRHYIVVDIISEWHDYRQKGRMDRNMRESHAQIANKRGSWGVGVDFYRMRTDSGQVFDVYYDRAPKDVFNRKGAWFLFQELKPES